MENYDVNEHWAELYRKALFEEDREKFPLLVEQAYRAVQRRVRELWYSRGRSKVSDKERRELHAAAYYLDLLRTLEARRRVSQEAS